MFVPYLNFQEHDVNFQISILAYLRLIIIHYILTEKWWIGEIKFLNYGLILLEPTENENRKVPFAKWRALSQKKCSPFNWIKKNTERGTKIVTFYNKIMVKCTLGF